MTATGTFRMRTGTGRRGIVTRIGSRTTGTRIIVSCSSILDSGFPPSDGLKRDRLGGSFLGAHLPSIEHAADFFGFQRKRDELLFINTIELIESIEHELQCVVLPDRMYDISELGPRWRELLKRYSLEHFGEE